MHTFFLGVLICVLFLPFTTPFLTAPVATVWTYTRRNLYCSQRTSTVYNGTTTYQNVMNLAWADYCLIAITTSLANNLTKTVTYQNGIYLWNNYRNIAIHQCNFSTTMDIGYGSCNPYYYETATSIQLCICSTNDCAATYASCQASVNQTLSSPPPLLPVLQPTLSNTITCQDYNATYSATHNIIPPLYAGCYYLSTLGEPDYSKCSTYTPNNTIICAVFYDPIQGSYQQMALIEGDYESLMSETIQFGAASSFGIPGYYQYQTSTSIATITPNGQYNRAFCLCTTNNCNVDFTTCTSGMSIPLYLFTNNGSTTSATSTSTAAIISSASITTSTSSALGSSITTLQSSTMTSVPTTISTTPTPPTTISTTSTAPTTISSTPTPPTTISTTPTTSITSTTTKLTASSTTSTTQSTTTVSMHGSWNTSGVTVAGSNGPGPSASQFNNPWDIALDSNNYLYVADYYNCRIQRWIVGNTSGVTVAGNGICNNGASQLSYPTGVFVDSSGVIYVADSGNQRVQRWSPGASVGTTVVVNVYCYGIYVDRNGAIYVSDVNNNQVLRWPASTGTNSIIIAGGNGQGGNPNQLNGTWGIYVDSSLSYIYVADANNHRIQKWQIGGSSGVTVCGGFGAGSGMNQLNTPTGVVVDSSGYIYVSDSGNNRIVQWAPGASNGILLVGSYGAQANQFNMPYSIRFDSNNNFYVVDRGNARIQAFYSQLTVNPGSSATHSSIALILPMFLAFICLMTI